MSTHAAFEPQTERYLRADFDDTYTRPLFEVLNDNELGGAARWRPEFGWTYPFEDNPTRYV